MHKNIHMKMLVDKDHEDKDDKSTTDSDREKKKKDFHGKVYMRN